MMNNAIRRMVLPLALMVVMNVCCTTPVQSTGGNSSETVIGSVVHGDGSPACSTIVILYPADYDPIADGSAQPQPRDTTDAAGNYVLQASDSVGDYSVVVTHLSSGDRALIHERVSGGDTTDMPVAVLSQPGVITVTAPDSAPSGYLYIPGTDIAATVSGGGGIVRLERVPAGIIPSIMHVSAADPQNPRVLRANVEVLSRDTVVIQNPQWRYSTRVYLNTTSSGAGVIGDVTDFPVLIRLTKENFDFSQANHSGMDIRFFDVDGESLMHEIELWDSSSAIAAVWVRVPLVRGNDDSQYMVMYWGNPSAKNRFGGESVFDTGVGYQGVWHLGGKGNTTVFDATDNHYDGTPVGMTDASSVPGAIGHARQFNGTSSYIHMPNTAESKLDFAENGTYAISLWAYADTVDTLWHGVVSKGHQHYYMQYKCFDAERLSWEFVEYKDMGGWEYSQHFLQPASGSKTWVHLTGVRDGSRQYLYVNGDLVQDTALVNDQWINERNTQCDFAIGCHLDHTVLPEIVGNYFFDGAIDEVQVMSRVPSADRVKLSYMNQRSDDALVEFE